ncbi:protein adenylyltransferase SelO [Sediminibacterium sp.]|uniref:protein adenylyltransferase SelO n=1 Tax=Sediminibacterium sp. TaxID=1917865 RepID=UPI003F71C850
MSNHIFNFNTSYASLGNSFFELVNPTPVKTPQLLLLNQALVKELGLQMNQGDERNEIFSPELALLLSGNKLFEGSEPMAQAYAGHQFGYFNMLGDGRAILLGEHISPKQKRFDIQLKGSGPTPYSRRGDGRATLRAMLREYLISEAMHGLGIPTSRSLAVVTTGEKVFREEIQDGAILTRVMQSHIRVGSFEYVSHYLTKEDLITYTNYTLARHYPTEVTSPNPALALLKQVLIQQVYLIVNWMRVGFIHGVMNTDNMSIAGETFDYGPCAFMNGYDPAKVFSSIDTNGRYAFANQPSIAHWNLSCLANALLPIIDEDQTKAIELAKEVLNLFPNLYTEEYTAMMGAKIGFVKDQLSDEVVALIKALLNWMKENQADYTNTFLQIQSGIISEGIYTSSFFAEWLLKREALLTKQGSSLTQAKALMQLQNPLLIPRNHWVETVLDSVSFTNDLTQFNSFLTALQSPYIQTPNIEKYQAPPENGDGFYATYCGT